MVRTALALGALALTAVSAAPVPQPLGAMLGAMGMSAQMGNDANGNTHSSTDQSDRSVTAPITNGQMYSFNNGFRSAAGARTAVDGWMANGGRHRGHHKRELDGEVPPFRRDLFDHLGPMALSMAQDVGRQSQNPFGFIKLPYAQKKKAESSEDAASAGSVERRALVLESAAGGGSKVGPNGQIWNFHKRDLARDGEHQLEPRFMGMLAGMGMMGGQMNVGSDANSNARQHMDQSLRSVNAPIRNGQMYSFGN